MVSRTGQEWLNASTGMPGFIELELVRPFKNKNSKAGGVQIGTQM